MNVLREVYKGRSNEISIQLLSGNDALASPEVITRVSVCVGGIVADTTSPNMEYDGVNGVLTLRLGMISALQSLPSRSYPVKITAYSDDDESGVAFPGLVVALKDWCGA